MQHPRSYLFVPGDRPDRFSKAATPGADEIIIDLEDAVAPALKDAAGDHAASWFAAGGRGMVRMNALETAHAEADLAMLAQVQTVGVMVPKASVASVGAVGARLREHFAPHTVRRKCSIL